MRTLSVTQVWKLSEYNPSSKYMLHVTDLVSDIEHIWQMSWRLGFYRGGPVLMSAMAGIDIALWDLKGMGSCQITFPLLIHCS